jgi:hypothetical protein
MIAAGGTRPTERRRRVADEDDEIEVSPLPRGAWPDDVAPTHTLDSIWDRNSFHGRISSSAVSQHTPKSPSRAAT